MPSQFVTRSLGHATGRIPGLRRIPVVRLLAIGEVGLIARNHLLRLTPEERRQLLALMREARGRPSSLSKDQREELADLVAKLEPRVLAAEAVHRLSPVPVPMRLMAGRRRRPTAADRSR
jgi:hypothetical protein